MAANVELDFYISMGISQNVFNWIGLFWCVQSQQFVLKWEFEIKSKMLFSNNLTRDIRWFYFIERSRCSYFEKYIFLKVTPLNLIVKIEFLISYAIH